jgi:hypothetical protein
VSKLGFHIGAHPTGLLELLRDTASAGSPVPVVFALDQNVASQRNEYSPSTLIVYRDQRFGSDNGNMYVGDGHAAGHAWARKLIPYWQLNPADFYAPINEPGRGDLDGLLWLNAFYQGCMDEAQDAGLRLCVGEWSTGKPPIDSASIATITPMLRQAAANGHVLGLHEYSLDGPMIGNPLCTRYRQMYAALPLDARPRIVISEAGPDSGYGAGYTLQDYVDVVGAYDLEITKDDYVIGACLFNYGGNENDLTEAVPLLKQWIIDHPAPPDSTTSLEERVTELEIAIRANTVAHQALRDDLLVFQSLLMDLDTRVTALEGATPPPPPAPVESAQGATMPPLPELIDAAGACWTFAAASTIHGHYILRNDEIFAGGMGELLLYWNRAIYTRNAEQKWYRADGAGWTIVAGDPRPVVPPPPPTVPVVRGLHMRADGNSNLLDFECLTTAKLTGAKIMSNTSFGELDSLIGLVPSSNILFRLFAAGNDPIWRDAARFFDVHRAWFDRLALRGVSWIEVGNENNLPQEGGFASAAVFADFYRRVVDLIRAAYPGKFKVVYPGLSPQPNVPEWMTSIQTLINEGRVDLVGVHSYWIDAADMNDETGGRFYRRFIALGKPLIMSEFANVGVISTDADKGREYKSYYASLESSVKAAYCFVSSASDPAFTKSRQTWVRNGALTDIPRQAGA